MGRPPSHLTHIWNTWLPCTGWWQWFLLGPDLWAENALAKSEKKTVAANADGPPDAARSGITC